MSFKRKITKGCKQRTLILKKRAKANFCEWNTKIILFFSQSNSKAARVPSDPNLWLIPKEARKKKTM